MRMSNIKKIENWVEGKKPKDLTPEYRKALLRLVMKELGVTRTKAQEYISFVLAED